MSDCCTPGSGFPNAATMQQLSTNFPVVWEEICMIQQAILAASSQCQPGGGQMCVTVGGNTPMTFVSGISSVTVVNGGSGYYIDTPLVQFIPPVGSVPTVAAEATITTNGGNILAVNVTNGGNNYQPVESTIDVSSVAGLGAVIKPLVDAEGRIVNVEIVNGGTGYTVNDTVTANRAVLPNVGYTSASFVITSVSSITGEITGIAVTNTGSGYQPSITQVKIVSSLNPLLPYPLGGGFIADVATDVTGAVTGVTVINTGAGYNNFPPYLVITNPGTGAVTSVNLSGTSVSSISVIEPGSQYALPAAGTVLNPPTASLPNPPVTDAEVVINVSTNPFGTNPNAYWMVTFGATTNKPIQMQLNSVLAYFKGLGYTITIKSNPSTGSTIQWHICW